VNSSSTPGRSKNRCSEMTPSGTSTGAFVCSRLSAAWHPSSFRAKTGAGLSSMSVGCTSGLFRPTASVKPAT